MFCSTAYPVSKYRRHFLRGDGRGSLCLFLVRCIFSTPLVLKDWFAMRPDVLCTPAFARAALGISLLWSRLSPILLFSLLRGYRAEPVFALTAAPQTVSGMLPFFFGRISRDRFFFFSPRLFDVFR